MNEIDAQIEESVSLVQVFIALRAMLVSGRSAEAEDETGHALEKFWGEIFGVKESLVKWPILRQPDCDSWQDIL